MVEAAVTTRCCLRVRRLIAVAGTAFSLCLARTPAAAQPAQPHPPRWSPALDVTITAGGADLWLATETFKPYLAPSRCRWCNVDALDAGVRDALVWRVTDAADTISNVTGFVLMPFAAVGLDALAAGHDGARGNVGEDLVLIAEAGVVAANVTQLTKMLVGRERPFVHALASAQKTRTREPADNNLSFFSGHTAEAFALAAASGTVGTLRGYRWAPLAWGVGGVVAATTAYLRIAADKHWLTDVVVGAVVGGAIGFAVPFLFHSAVDDTIRASSASAPRTTALQAFVVLW